MESIQQRDSQWRQEEAAMEPWTNARIDPHDLFPSYPRVEAMCGGLFSDMHIYRSTTPEDSPMSRRGGLSEPNSEIFEGVGLEIGFNTFDTSDDSWTPLRLPGACVLGVGNFHLASGKINDDLKPVHSPPWSANIGTTAFTRPGSLDSSFYYTQDENKMLVEHPLSTRRVPSVRPPSTCTSVSSTPLSASVLNQHQSDLYSGSEAQQASSVNFRSQVTGPASSSDPTSCPKARPRASGPRVKAACTTCKTRKVKCDGSTPGCNRCVRGGFRCDGFPAFKSPGRVALLCRKCRSSDGSSSSNASIISTPSLSWSASSVAESDEIVNTDLKLPHDRQQGGNVLEKMRLKQLRIACSACHTAKVKCRCPPHKKEYDSIASQFESRSPSQVADSGSSGLERTSYQISSKQVGNVSPSPVRSTQYALTPGHISQDLTPSTHAKTNFSMEKPWLFDKSQVLTPPRHAQDRLSGDVDMEAPPNDPSLPSYPWHDIPIMGSSMMHNTESNMAQIRETPTEDPSKQRGEFIRGYHPDQEGQEVEPNVFKFDDCPPSSNEASHIQLQKDITKIPAWATSFRAEWLELAGADPISFEKGSIEPVELPAFPLYHREKATSLVSPELGSMEEYMESFKSSTPFNAYLPRYSPTESGLESFPLPPNVPKVAQSSGALVLSERSENSTGTGVLSGSSSPLPISDVFPSTNQYSYGFESTRKKVRCKYSKAESPSETINKLAQGDHSPSPSFDSFCNNLLEAATLLETKILPPAEFNVHQIPSSSVEHSSESLLEASASRDQLQISSTVLPKAKQTLTTFQMQDSGPPSSLTLDEKRAIETMPSVDGGSSSSRSNTLSSFTEDETDWGEDEVINSVQDLDFSSFSSISQEDCLSQARVKDSLTRPVFSPMKQALIDRIMKEFWIIFNQETEGIQNRSPSTPVVESAGNYKCNTDTNCEGGDHPSQNSGSRSSTQVTNTREKSTQSTLGPRKRDDEDDQEGKDSEEQSPKRPRTILTPPQNPDDNAKFACPYRKRDPRKYCVQFWRPCALTPQDTVARVKGHLYRHHRIYPCQRCKTLFEDQDAVNQHLMQRNGCELRDTEHVDGITTEIHEKLRTKKKAQRDQTEADRWKDIFKLLFPGEMIPSPYFEAVQEEIVLSPDSRELEDYEEYCRRELPRTFRAALEETVHNELQSMEESIRNQLMNIIRDCQDRVFSRYRSSTAAAVGSPSRSPMLSRSPAVDNSQDSINSISMATNAQTEARIAPPFFQPPPPQYHLRSRLEVSDIQMNSSKAPGGSAPSDSGYSSNESGNILAIGSSSGTTCDSVCMSNFQPVVASATFPAANEETTWNMDSEQFNVTAGNDVSDSKKNRIFENSFNNGFDNDFDNATENALDGSFDTSQYASQFMYGNSWDPSMDNLGLENLFSSDETL